MSKIVVWKRQLEIWLFWYCSYVKFRRVVDFCARQGLSHIARKIFNGSSVTLASQFHADDDEHLVWNQVELMRNWCVKESFPGFHSVDRSGEFRDIQVFQQRVWSWQLVSMWICSKYDKPWSSSSWGSLIEARTSQRVQSCHQLKEKTPSTSWVKILSSIHVDKVQTSERFDGFSPIPWQCRLSFSKDASSWMVLSVAEFAFAYPSDFLRAPNLRFGLVYNDKSEQFVKLAKTCGCYNSGGAMPVGNFGR